MFVYKNNVSQERKGFTKVMKRGRSAVEIIIEMEVCLRYLIVF